MSDDLFLLYCADVTNIAERHGVTAHSYADDTQLYVNTKTQQCATEATRLTSCIAELDSWMTSNRLRLNSDKTVYLGRFSPAPANVAVTEIMLSGFSIKTSPVVTCLGVKIDAELTFSTHVKQIAARFFGQIS